MLRSRKNPWLVVQFALLVTVHLPLPCYDCDGENRGVVTEGIFDPAAWHFLLLGIMPESDIDRGPFNSDPDRQNHGGTVFDEPYVAAAKGAQAKLVIFDHFADRWFRDHQMQISVLTAVDCKRCVATIPRTFAASFSARTPQAWLQLLGVLIV